MNNYGIDIWGDNNFLIHDGLLKINHGCKPAIIDIVQKIRKDGNKGPLLLRFNHITQKQISKLYNTFNNSINEYNYEGKFQAVFPLKVNQLPNFVLPLINNSKELNYGLEAGSKTELIIAMTYNNTNAPITINGFKDKEMISLCFIAAQMGHNITVIIEGLNELETIIEVKEESKDLKCPNIGLRVKLHNSSNGAWAKSGGINSKFGLSSTEILKAYEIITKHNLIDQLTMLHFHIGSAMNTISPLKKALKEAGNIYAQLKQMGANNLLNINIGGGLNIEYSQFQRCVNYSIEEFANDVVFTLQNIATSKGVSQPNIFTESGRYISAASTILITPVLELYSSQSLPSDIKLKDENPKLIIELYDLYKTINKKLALEFMHDALEHLESILTLFDLGYVDLQDRSNAEVLTHLIIKKAIALLDFNNYTELKNISDRIQEKYLLNFSMFQSLPDFWGINQEFPVMPLTHLNTNPTRFATLWDITCDSDGEIPFDANKPLYLHDIDLKNEEYFLGFFLVGAYQEILGMKHNLFSSPTQINIDFDKNGDIKFNNIIESQKILDILDDIDYDINDIKNILKNKLANDDIWEILNNYIHDNGYLKTTKE
jgi:arginine decarboxylase